MDDRRFISQTRQVVWESFPPIRFSGCVSCALCLLCGFYYTVWFVWQTQTEKEKTKKILSWVVDNVAFRQSDLVVEQYFVPPSIIQHLKGTRQEERARKRGIEKWKTETGTRKRETETEERDRKKKWKGNEIGKRQEEERRRQEQRKRKQKKVGERCEERQMKKEMEPSNAYCFSPMSGGW